MSKYPASVLDFDFDGIHYIAKIGSGPYNLAVQIPRLRLLKAARRLGIDPNLWTKIPVAAMPLNYGFRFNGPTLTLPDFDVMRQSQPQWKQAARQHFQKEVKKFLEFVNGQVTKQVASGGLARMKAPRSGGSNVPLEKREEWAVKRFLLGQEIKDIAGGKYNVSRVAEAIAALLKEAGLDTKPTK